MFGRFVAIIETESALKNGDKGEIDENRDGVQKGYTDAPWNCGAYGCVIPS